MCYLLSSSPITISRALYDPYINPFTLLPVYAGHSSAELSGKQGDHRDPEITKKSKDCNVSMSTFSQMEDLLALAKKR